MSASRIVPICAICVLLLVVFLNAVRGKKAQTFDGVFVRMLPREEFYPGVTRCPLSGTSYWLMSNSEFDEQTTMDAKDLARHVQGVWRVRFIGDLSSIGRYGRYWRVVRVSSVLRVERLDSCENLE
jgi:hypothetical protein